LLPGHRGPAPTGQQPEPVVQPRGDLLHRQRPDPGRRKLERQREPVELTTNLRDCGRVLLGHAERGHDGTRAHHE
jgi:hypothetical protein